MLNLLKKLKSNAKPVYVYLSSPETAKRFLSDEEEHGLRFSDGSKPTDKRPDSFFAVHPDMTINYLGAVGRIAYQCNSDSIIRYDYTAKKAK